MARSRIPGKRASLKAGAVAVGLAGAFLSGQVAGAAVLTAITPGALPQAETLFTSEWKRDQNVDNPGRRGHDAFLRGDATRSFGVRWGASGESHDWSLTHNGAAVTLTVEGTSRTVDAGPGGPWGAVKFYLRANDFGRFETSTATVVVTEVNGMALSGISESATDGTGEALFALAGLEAITSLSGKLTFDFDVRDGARGSPNGRFRVDVTGYSVAAVPLAPSGVLLALGLGGLGCIARRQFRKA